MKVLHLYDHTDNWERRAGYAAEYCDDYEVTTGRCKKAKPRVIHAGVASLADVVAMIEAKGKQQGYLAGLVFHTHGSPGEAYLPNGSIHSGNVHRLRPPCSRSLAWGAKVAFLGCNVAEGGAGSWFLQEAGRAMLAHVGGWVYGIDSVTLSIPGLGQTKPPWGDYVGFRVDAGGAVSQLTSGPDWLQVFLDFP
jgi:hypothetical protein